MFFLDNVIAVVCLIRAQCSLLGNISGTTIFESVQTCREAQEFRNIKIIRYEESIYYINVDNFKYQVMKLSGINPEERSKKIYRECTKKHKELDKVASRQNKCLIEKKTVNNLSLDDYVLDQVKFEISLRLIT